MAQAGVTGVVALIFYTFPEVVGALICYTLADEGRETVEGDSRAGRAL